MDGVAGTVSERGAGMTITTTTIIGFLIPEDSKEYELFKQSHNLSKWKMDCISSLITFEQTQTIFTTITVEGEPE